MGFLCLLVQDREDTSSLTDLQIVQYHCDTDRVQAAQFQSMGAFTKKPVDWWTSMLMVLKNVEL